jgi:hypothetical protein
MQVHVVMGSWNKQQGARGRRPALLVTEGAEKQDVARACDQQMRKHRALKIAQEAEAVEEAMNSNWTKPAEKKLIQFRHERPGVWESPVCCLSSVRVRVHLEKKPTATDAENGEARPLRDPPLPARFGPSTTAKWLQANNSRSPHPRKRRPMMHGAHHGRSEAAMARAWCLSFLPKKDAKHKHWHAQHAKNP